MTPATPPLLRALALTLVLATGCYERVVLHPRSVGSLDGHGRDRPPVTVTTADGRTTEVEGDYRALVFRRDNGDLVLRPPVRIDVRTHGWRMTDAEGRRSAVLERDVHRVWLVRRASSRGHWAVGAGVLGAATSVLLIGANMRHLCPPGDPDPGVCPAFGMLLGVPIGTALFVGTSLALTKDF